MKYSIVVTTIFLFNLSIALATETTSAVSSSTTSAATKADLDAEVSDAKLRADSGSKSKLSLSFTSTYSGASATKPFGKERPQIGASDTADPVSMGGGFGGRYRLNKNESLYVATGYYQELGDSESKTEFSNPLISYNNTFGADDLQIGSAITASFTTQDRKQAVGNVGTLSARISALTNSQSGLSGGVYAYVLYTYYREGFERFDDRQMDYGFHLGPMISFRKSDKVNFYSNIMAVNLSHIKRDAEFNMVSDEISQNIGVGFAPVRDFYISPFASFYWDRLSARKTAVNLTASINIF
jgi:hypothetical protein